MQFIVRRGRPTTTTDAASAAASTSDETEYLEAVKFVRKYGCSVLSMDAYTRLNTMHDSIESGEASEDRVKEAYINTLSSDLRRKCLVATIVGLVFAVVLFVLILLAASRLAESARSTGP